MFYRRFKLPETTLTPATVATFATVQAPKTDSVATVASVAKAQPEISIPAGTETVASVATVAGVQPDFAHWDEEDWQAACDERAAILEYDGGFPRAEAERLAGDEISGLRAAALLGENGALHVEHVEQVEVSGREGDR